MVDFIIRFNPRAPCGARRDEEEAGLFAEAFQSTRPVWGATFASCASATHEAVSIHAPRVGRDFLIRRDDRRIVVSIHAPRVGRDLCIRRPPEIREVSIHAPRVGRDRRRHAENIGGGVSIHAPRVGRDRSPRCAHRRRRHFNPRAPCGARHDRFMRPPPFARFNPRAPCGARPRTCHKYSFIFGFQSTRPVWGATEVNFGGAALDTFQSTRPVWGATRGQQAPCGALGVSIHAPRVGRDELRSILAEAVGVFQSTRPVWGATGQVFTAHRSFRVSIHAPRVGRDMPSFAPIAVGLSFNPRAPCGARPVSRPYALAILLFQSTRPMRGATTCS